MDVFHHDRTRDRLGQPSIIGFERQELQAAAQICATHALRGQRSRFTRGRIVLVKMTPDLCSLLPDQLRIEPAQVGLVPGEDGRGEDFGHFVGVQRANGGFDLRE